MMLNIKPYKKHKLNADLSLDEELALLVLKELYIDTPLSTSELLEPLNLSSGYLSRLVRGLINRGYLKRIGLNDLVEVVNPTNDFIDTDFVFTNDLTLDNKRMIVLLYKTFENSNEINLSKLNKDIPNRLTIELIDTLLEEGIVMDSIPINFEDIFSLNSCYDS